MFTKSNCQIIISDLIIPDMSRPDIRLHRRCYVPAEVDEAGCASLLEKDCLQADAALFRQ